MNRFCAIGVALNIVLLVGLGCSQDPKQRRYDGRTISQWIGFFRQG